MEILLLICGILVAYLLGSVPSSVWIGRSFYGIDLRTQGSGNAGATNTIRVLGTRAGIVVLLIDVFKGWLAVYLAVNFVPVNFTPTQTNIYQIVAGLAAVFGHVYPVFVGFRGGKGIATFVGVGITLFPWSVLVVFGIFVIMLISTKYVSVASMTGAICFPFIVIFIFNPHSLPLVLLAIFVGIFIPFTHRKNIQRLLNGTESKFTFKKKK